MTARLLVLVVASGFFAAFTVLNARLSILATANYSQNAVSALLTGSIFLLAALGLTLTYGILRFPNVAHAELMTTGAYVALSTATLAPTALGYPSGTVEYEQAGFLLGAVTGPLTAGLVGVLSYLLVFRPLVRRGATFIHLAIASVGLGITLRFVIRQVWGPELRSIPAAFGGFDIGPARVAYLWLATIMTAGLAALAFHLLLRRTKLGKAMRATSNNLILAMASGINTERVILFVWFVGSALAGLGGVFAGAVGRVIPDMGFDILISAFAVVILGGIGSFYGALVAAYVIGAAQSFGVVYLTALRINQELNVAIGFVILVLILLVKPEGIVELRLPRLSRRGGVLPLPA